jgi:RNA polymerase sigma-70 factor (ECF subfamily)
VTYRQDKALARRVAKGDEQAFREFFDHYYPRVYRFCLRRLQDDTAEDAAQAVMIQAVRAVATYRGEAALFTWLCQIARNQISEYYRRNAKHRHLVAIDDNDAVRAEVESLEADPALAPEVALQHSQRQQLVQLILDHLPGNYGSVLEWKYIEGLSVKEIAERLETTTTAVQSMLGRARPAFQHEYQALAAEVQNLLSDTTTRSQE